VSSTVDPEVVEDDWPWEQEQEQEQDKVLEEEEEVDAEDRILSPAIESAAQTASDTSTVSTTERTVEGISFEPVGDVEGFRPGTMTSTALQDLASVCAICNEAAIEFIDGRFTRLGEPTEAALKVQTHCHYDKIIRSILIKVHSSQVFVEKLGTANFPKSTDPVQMAKQCNEYWSGKYSRLATLEFSRDRKCMSVLCRSKDRRINRLMVKGAAEMMLSKCNRLKLEDGSVVPITIELRSRLEEKISEMARRPLRCLAMAFKEGADLGPLDTFVDEVEASHSPLLTDTTNFKELETELILVGICGIKDPARGEVADAMLRCKTAGIRVIMITGDSKETAVSIAKEVHILDPKDDNQLNAFTGAEFFSLSEVEQLNLLRYGNKVFCRAEPVHKQKLISMLSALGEITAMTGDGVNDSPALQQADIGIAMGITGSEVAKEAADMILADDNFATIVSAVEEGRCIYSNMQSFISFLISANIGEIFTVFFATLLGLPEPLSPLLLLWLNLVTDGPPATALGFNPADPNIMKLPPRPRDEPILSKWLLVRYLITGIYVSFATIGVFVWWYLDKGVTLWQLSRWGSCSTWPDFSNSYLFCDEAKPCEIFTAHKGVAQTLSLSALVVMEVQR
jgi:Ca2+-transporting ATPase